MYKITVYISVFLVSLFCSMYGQTSDSLQIENKKNYVLPFREGINYDLNQSDEIFQAKVTRISNKLDETVKQNKEALKKDLFALEQQIKNKELSVEQAEELKNEKAVFYANKIDEATVLAEQELKSAIQKKVDNQLNLKASLNDYIKSLIEKRSFVILSLGFGSSLMFIDGGLNTEMYKTKAISAFNFGIEAKTRLVKDNPHYYLKYGLSFYYNSLKPTNQRVLDLVDNQTVLIDYEKHLRKSRIDFTESRLSTYFEYDFSEKSEDKYGNVILKSRQSYFFGLGGFLGYGNNKIEQVMKYKTEGKVHKNREVGNFGANKFIYGVGAYIGHKNVSLFATYNLNPTFKHSEKKHHFLNIGLNLDLF